MKLVLLSGGTGTRLWPLSHPSCPKQFIRLFHDDHGNPESILQRNIRLLRSLGMSEHTWISSVSAQHELLQEQLPEEIPVILEPEGRDTFPAIALVCSYLYTEQRLSQDEVIVFCPADLYVDDTFFKEIQDLQSTVDWSHSPVVLVGVEPEAPLEKYGYIIPDSPDFSRKVNFVKQFVEKPDAELARACLARHALWNSGVFMFSLGFLMQYLEDNGYPTQYKQLVQQYSRLPKISFDYAVLEQYDNLVVAKYSGTWRDIGSWEQLMQVLECTQIGTHIVTYQSEGSDVLNTSDLPMMVIGVSDLLIVASNHGILVADKSKADIVKMFLQQK